MKLIKLTDSEYYELTDLLNEIDPSYAQHVESCIIKLPKFHRTKSSDGPMHGNQISSNPTNNCHIRRNPKELETSRVVRYVFRSKRWFRPIKKGVRDSVAAVMLRYYAANVESDHNVLAKTFGVSLEWVDNVVAGLSYTKATTPPFIPWYEGITEKTIPAALFYMLESTNKPLTVVCSDFNKKFGLIGRETARKILLGKCRGCPKNISASREEYEKLVKLVTNL